MAVTHEGVFVQTPNCTPQEFTNANAAQTKKQIVQGGNDGTKLVAITATSTETANARVAQVWLTTTGSPQTEFLVTSCNIPVNSGFDGTTASVNLMSLWTGLPTDNDGQPYFFVKSGYAIQVSLTSQVASGKKVDIVPVAADF